MTFTAPWALLGLLAAAVPILLHLVQRRDPPERAFPAVQYLEDATRDHRRRLRLRHWLLLALRTLLIIALVLAAAGMQAPRAVPLGRHAPTAMVLVLDNSASSAVVRDGQPLLDALRHSAREVLARATPADRLWLMLADGVPRPGGAAELLGRLDQVVPLPVRLDLGLAIRHGRELIVGSGIGGMVVVVSDAQRSAVGPVEGAVPLLVLQPAGQPPANRALGRLEAGSQPWGADGGRVTVAVAAEDTVPVPVTLGIDGRPSRDILVTPGVPVAERLAAPPAGWWVLRATLPPDELRLDDARVVALHVAPPATATWSVDDRFLDAALTVLVEAGRLSRGSGVRIGELGTGASIVLPPADPALIGALNRTLAARGASWRYGALSAAPVASDSGALLADRVAVRRRVTLEAVGSGADTLVTVDGEPWIVRSGELVLVGSRLEPEWTDLPARASFVPLLDALVTRTVRGEPTLPQAVSGTPVVLPGRVTTIDGGAGRMAVEGGAPWSPPHPGVYWLLDGHDTLGAVAAAVDPRESDLARATDGDLQAAWPGAVVAPLAEGADRSFAAGGRGDLRPLLLVLGLACAIGESLLAGRRARVG